MSQDRSAAERLLKFIDQAPSPWHAAEQVRLQLEAAGFLRLYEHEQWQLTPGRGYYVLRDGSSIAAFYLGHQARQVGFRIVGAHTDSPGLRIKPRAAHGRADNLALGVEIYGGPIVATFADRDLSLAGRVILSDDQRLDSVLYASERPLVRLPTPAIHLNREVNERGLKFEPQEELSLVLGALAHQLPADQVFRKFLAQQLGEDPQRIVSWELAAVDSQPSGFFGLDEEFIAAPRLDNLASCHAGVEALIEAGELPGIGMLVFFDHEEVGSLSYKGAEGSFLPDVVQRVGTALGLEHPGELQALLARSILFSADMAHGLHPNFQGLYEEHHAPVLNGGPAVKINAKQRYATDGLGQAYFQRLCAEEGVANQVYVHRNNLPCGSTIGPITAARLGIRTIDIGNPMWSMHSARESAGARDHGPMIRVMRRFYADPHGFAG